MVYHGLWRWFVPYAVDFCGIYRIVNRATNECYVGQSQRVKKRLREHFRLLESKKHPNPRLQNSYNKYGSDSFFSEMEVVVDDLHELDMLEEGFINGEAKFDSPVVFNVANFAKAPMRGKFHSEETRCKIRKAMADSGFDYASPEWRAKLRSGQQRRFIEDEAFRKKVLFVLENDHLTYAERGRILGSDTSSVRRLYLKYRDKKELFKC
jgi:group I intron endonuclease